MKMAYKKIELVAGSNIPIKEGTKTLRAIKKAYSLLKKDFSAGTNNMAEVWVKGNELKKSQKVKKLKDGTVLMAKNMAGDLKKSLNGISAKGAICDISYEIGGAFKKTKDVFNEYIDEMTRIPNGK